MRAGKRPHPLVSALSWLPCVRIAFGVPALYGEVDITIPVANKMICVSSTAPEMTRQHALRWVSSRKVGVEPQLVDRGLISARGQVGVNNLMLGDARKWHWAALRVPIVSSAGGLINEE